MAGTIASTFDAATADAARWLIARALEEDLGGREDLTSHGLVPESARGTAQLLTRASGVLCGMAVCRLIVDEFARDVQLSVAVDDGQPVGPRSVVGTLSGQARELLRIERTLLNFLGRLSGIASLTASYVAAVGGTRAKVLDTRKTTPGWRRLEKYAVRCGGGVNHRMGLYDAVLIKDNHLALVRHLPDQPLTTEQAIHQMRAWLRENASEGGESAPWIEVEVDSLDQLQTAIRARPEVVLLDNMSVDQLRACVQYRDAHAPGILLEASGGVHLFTIGAIARTGVDRISVGALTHSAFNFDIGLDWVDDSDR